MPPVFILLRSHWVLQTSISTKALRVSSSSANKNIQNELCWDVLTEVVSRRFGDGFPPVNWITKFKRISPPRLNICIKIGTLVISTVSKFNHFKLVGSKLEEFGSRSQIRGWMMIFQICHTELRQVGEDSAKANTTIVSEPHSFDPLWFIHPFTVMDDVSAEMQWDLPVALPSSPASPSKNPGDRDARRRKENSFNMGCEYKCTLYLFE